MDFANASEEVSKEGNKERGPEGAVTTGIHQVINVTYRYDILQE